MDIADPLPDLTGLSFSWSGEDNVLAPDQTVEATATLTLTQEHIDGGLLQMLTTALASPVRLEHGSSARSVFER